MIVNRRSPSRSELCTSTDTSAVIEVSLEIGFPHLEGGPSPRATVRDIEVRGAENHGPDLRPRHGCDDAVRAHQVPRPACQSRFWPSLPGRFVFDIEGR